MNINVISIFPEILDSSFKGLTGKALEKNIAKLKLIDLKEFSNNDYGSIDDAPYGGGERMVIGVEPLEKSLKTIKKPGHIICLTPQGKVFNQTKAVDLSNYVLSGGEIAASVIIDAILRNLDDVIGNQDSVNKDSHSDGKLKGHVYTRPSDFKGKKVPEILLSGDHKKINEWKLANSLWVTREKRPDLFKQLQLSEKEMILLRQYGDLLTKKHE